MDLNKLILNAIMTVTAWALGTVTDFLAESDTIRDTQTGNSFILFRQPLPMNVHNAEGIARPIPSYHTS